MSGDAAAAPAAAGAPAASDGVWVMCQFLHRYLEFRLPEVESLAEMEGFGGQLEWCALAAVAAANREHACVAPLRGCCGCAKPAQAPPAPWVCEMCR
jgi:hypothetical protein